MDISFIIVNYNTATITEQCIKALLQQQHNGFEIIVIDNASRDNSLEVLSAYKDRIILVENHDNKGFAKAANQAVKYAKGRFLYILNPDAFLQNPDDLSKIIAFMDDHPDFGIVGTQILQADGFSEPTVYKQYPGEEVIQGQFKHLPGQIAWVYGASMIIRREAYEKVQGFDEDYFVYAEDTDICKRVREAGYAIGYYGGVYVKHIGRASESTTPQYEFRVRRQTSLHTFYRKHYSPQQASQIVKARFNIARKSFRIHKIKRLFYRTKRLEKHYQKTKAIMDTSKQFLGL